jgi:hypothetical protein
MESRNAARATRARRRWLSRRGAAAVAILGAVVVAGVAATPASARRPAVTQLQITPGEESLKPSWRVTTTVGLTGFRVRWRLAASTSWSQPVELGLKRRSYKITGLSVQGYEVLVRALYEGRPAGGMIGTATPLPEVGEEPPPKEEPPNEEPPNEEPPPEEEPPPGEEGEEEPPGTVSATPKGPSTPLGGWSVVYANAFAAPIGSGPGQDNTLFPNNCAEYKNCEGFNSNEMQVFNPRAVSTGPDGLKLTCTHTETAQAPGSKHYVCGVVKGLGTGAPGYDIFYWTPGLGQTLVFETVAKFPRNTGEADPGWWSNGPPWSESEFDFFEGGGWGSQHTTGWKTDDLFMSWFAPPHPWAVKRGFDVDPSAGFHTYTTEIFPTGIFSEWIDGVPQPWGTGIGPAFPITTLKSGLILSYALRTCSECSTSFTSGTREFDVRSIAVYEDSIHRGVGIENEGVAPGTTVE